MVTVNLESKKQHIVVETLQRLEQATTNKLESVTQLSRGTINNVLKTLRDKGMIHISSWDWTNSRSMVRVYKWGRGRDVERPLIDYKYRDKKEKEKLLLNFE
jgi:predicted transcriptional regulator